MSWVTQLGEPKIVYSLAAVGLLETLVLDLRRRLRRSERSPKDFAWMYWVGIPAAGLLTTWMKGWIQRPRPFPAELGWSFPSGHATLAFALATALSVRWPRLWIVWYGMAVCVGISRIALGVHWPSDIVAGAVVGSGTVYGFAWMQRKWIRGG